MKKNCKRRIKKELRIEKVIKIKGDELYVKLKGYGSSFNWWIDKKRFGVILLKFNFIKMSKYFPNSCRSFRRNINVKADLSNYGTKAEIINISHIDASGFALKTNLANLKTGVVHVPIGLSKLSDVAKNDVAKENCI